MKLAKRLRRRLFSDGWVPARRVRALHQIGWIESVKHGRPIDADARPVPWFTYSAISFLDQVVPDDTTVLEIGGGNSSLWWTARNCPVTVIEADQTWADELRAQGIHDIAVVASADGVRESLQALLISGRRFGVVVVDGIAPRDRYLNEAAQLVDDNGLLVFDNSDRLAYRSALGGLNGFHRFDFFGMGPQNGYAWATSVFARNGIIPAGRPETFPRSKY